MAAHQSLELSHFGNEIIGRLIRYESHLIEVKRELWEVNRKLDHLLSLSTVDHTPGFYDSSVLNGVDQTPIQNGPPGLEVFNVPGYPEEQYQWNPNSSQETPAPTLGDLYTLPLMAPPKSMVFRDGGWGDPIPTFRGVGRVPSTFGIPDGVAGGHESQQQFGGTFPGGGDNYHQSVGQQAETSMTSLVTTKPEIIENEIQEESNSLAVSSSGGGFDRRASTKEKTQCFAQICRELDIPWKGDEPTTLRTIIQRCGGTVPTPQEPTIGAIRNERVRREREARRVYFEELGRLVGLDGRIRELKILERVLALATRVRRNEEWHKAHPVPGPST